MLKIMKENVEDLFSPNLWLAIPAEMIGTLVITLLGCGTFVFPVATNQVPDVVQISLTFGLAVGTMVWVFAHVSGGYFNPAVTAACLFTRRLSIIRGVLYIVSQIVGAIVGAGILYGLSPEYVTQLSSSGMGGGNLGTNVLNPNITSAQGFGVEVMITMVLALAYFSSQDDKRRDLKGSAPLTIGLAVVACHLFAVRITSAGMNPARSFGPAVIQGSWEHHWVFWVGPLVGAITTGLIYEYIFAAGATFAGVTKCLLRTKKPRQNTPEEPEKAPLEEVKSDGNGIEETKVDEEKVDGVTSEEVTPETAKVDVEEVNAKTD